MATSHKSKSVRCPFYKYDKRNLIKCEGVIPDSNSTNVFVRHEDKRVQMALFCEKDYKKCEHYRAVMEAKYEEE